MLTTDFLPRLVAYLNWISLEIKDHLPWTSRKFGWKVRWRMRYDHNPVFIELADKYLVKAFAKERGVRTAQLFYTTDQPETIPFDSLPETYFIKANHGCGWNMLCKERHFYSYHTNVDFRGDNNIKQYVLSREEVIQLCKARLKQRYSCHEWAYQHIVPKIIVEERLFPRKGTELIDYKFYTFDGKAILVDVLSSTSRQNHEDFFLNMNWQAVDPAYIYAHNLSERIPEKPETLQEMIRVAEMLGRGLDFVRVDLNDTTLGIVLGEMTLYPEGGRLK